MNAAQLGSDASNRVVVYQSADRDGSTFELSPSARRLLQRRFAGALHLAPRVFIAHSSQADFERLHGSLGQQIIILLTGLTAERLQEVGAVEFRDPVTEQPLH